MQSFILAKVQTKDKETSSYVHPFFFPKRTFFSTLLQRDKKDNLSYTPSLSMAASRIGKHRRQLSNDPPSSSIALNFFLIFFPCLKANLEMNQGKTRSRISLPLRCGLQTSRHCWVQTSYGVIFHRRNSTH